MCCVSTAVLQVTQAKHDEPLRNQTYKKCEHAAARGRCTQQIQLILVVDSGRRYAFFSWQQKMFAFL